MKSKSPIKKAKNEWTKKDFVLHLSQIMKKQELENPRLKRIHAQLTPEWTEIKKLIFLMMQTTDEKNETDLVEKIAAHGEAALYPLIEVLLSLKKITPPTLP